MLLLVLLLLHLKVLLLLIEVLLLLLRVLLEVLMLLHVALLPVPVGCCGGYLNIIAVTEYEHYIG